jgi:tRNA(Ile)-lysidine synthase
VTGPDPAVSAARRAVRRELADISDGGLVLVAVSGGPDSLALAAATAFVAPRRGFRAGALVVDHHLQPGSAGVAKQAAATCRTLGLSPVTVLGVTVEPGRAGPEAAARSARYAALKAAAAGQGADAVLLGHTRDDQAETVLLRLARGSGSRSLSAMAPRRGVFRRPLLDLPRTSTAQVCRALGLTPWQDPHNEDPRFTRPRVRAALPLLQDVLGPGVSAALARTAALAREDADALDAFAEQAHREIDPRGLGALDVEPVARLLPAVRRRVLRRALLAAGCPAGDLSRTHVLAVDALITSWHGQGPVGLPGALMARRSCGRLHLVDRSEMGDDLAAVLVSEEQIASRIAEIGAQIDADYAGGDLLLVGVLKGAVMIMADLSRALRHRAEMDWMAVSSYGSGTKSSGVVRILKDLDQDITGRHVLVVEDILDSGLTLSWLLANLRSRGPASVEVCTLLRKPAAAKVDVEVRYVGFDIPNEFVVGYGLDHAQKYRNLRFVGTLAPHIYS